jgi:uncharacterized membrane protein (DUF485 family)
VADYTETWRTYRRRRNRHIFILVSIFIVLPIFAVLGRLLHKEEVFSAIAGLLALAWFVAVVVTSYQVQYLRCPRCGKQFSSKWWYHMGMAFVRRCAHCGLPKYAVSDLDKR